MDNEKIFIFGVVLLLYEDKFVIFLRYGFMKWVNKENRNIDEIDKNFIWWSCLLLYERFMFDLCVVSEERCYIRIVCCVMKILVKGLRECLN